MTLDSLDFAQLPEIYLIIYLNILSTEKKTITYSILVKDVK